MTYLVAAYIAIWFILFFYLFSLSSRQKRLSEEISNLKKQLHL
jgi:CcmD family protein